MNAEPKCILTVLEKCLGSEGDGGGGWWVVFEWSQWGLMGSEGMTWILSSTMKHKDVVISFTYYTLLYSGG